jgi:hypothetical protein
MENNEIKNNQKNNNTLLFMGANFLRCAKILSQRHLFLSVLPIFFTM